MGVHPHVARAVELPADVAGQRIGIAGCSECPKALVEQLVVRLILTDHEVAGIVIQRVLVYVMHLSRQRQTATERPFRDDDVFEDGTCAARSGMTRNVKHHVPAHLTPWNCHSVCLSHQ